ncbi:MAG: radical SAM/SPASM domain-containing protein [Candidatus Firestonebacteria bacterium]
MANKILRWVKTINYPSYVIFFVTAKCNANCKMCFYKDNMIKMEGAKNELTVEEYEKISKSLKLINILGISGGEPFLRDDLSEIIKILYKNCSPLVVDLPTNGFYTQKIVSQVEDIAKHCKNMTVDVQLSIDGPEKIHNEIRGLKDGFSRLKETYKELSELKKKYKNLYLKGCVVYSSYNQNSIEELFDILNKDFKNFDRILFSVAHGSVSNAEVFNFDWDKYFRICDKIRNTAVVKNITDFHSIFTIALRMLKNDRLKEVLKTKDMYKKCGAGKRVIVVNETGKVFPCEPLWQPVGDLRANNYNMEEILNSKEMKDFKKNIIKKKCTCHWGLPLSNTLIYTPKYYPKILLEMSKIIGRSMSSEGSRGL